MYSDNWSAAWRRSILLIFVVSPLHDRQQASALSEVDHDLAASLTKGLGVEDASQELPAMDAVSQCVRAEHEEMAEEARLGLGEQLHSILEAHETPSRNVGQRLDGIRRIVHPARVMAVIKDHEDGVVAWAKLVMDTPHPPEYLGVSFGREAFAIRNAGVQKTNVLVLYPGAEKPDKCGELADANIEIAVTSMEWLEKCKENTQRLPKVHLFVDTGHGYVGVLVPKAKAVMKSALSQGFQIGGIMSHLCCSGWGVPLECAVLKAGRHTSKVRRMHSTQTSRVHRAMKELMHVWHKYAPKRHPKPLIHVSPSGPITKRDSSLFYDMVRPGRILLQNAWDQKEKNGALSSFGLVTPSTTGSVTHEGSFSYQKGTPKKHTGRRLMRSRSVTDPGDHRQAAPLGHEALLEEALTDHVMIMLSADMEKTLPAGWCMGYYCQNEQGSVEVFDRPFRVGIPHFLVSGREVSDVDQVSSCREHATGRKLPLLDRGPYGLVLDLTLASRTRPLAIQCAMNA